MNFLKPVAAFIEISHRSLGFDQAFTFGILSRRKCFMYWDPLKARGWFSVTFPGRVKDLSDVGVNAVVPLMLALQSPRVETHLEGWR